MEQLPDEKIRAGIFINSDDFALGKDLVENPKNVKTYLKKSEVQERLSKGLLYV